MLNRNAVFCVLYNLFNMSLPAESYNIHPYSTFDLIKAC